VEVMEVNFDLVPACPEFRRFGLARFKGSLRDRFRAKAEGVGHFIFISAKMESGCGRESFRFSLSGRGEGSPRLVPVPSLWHFFLTPTLFSCCYQHR
jgi:hypothetical protein